ncbi:unnamed protein product [Enterobius vermicularis]|uniref:Uncharacterized protein n=1 Tax=Enterobius vermicularis TaxID=51028 RepID=A0A0N4VRB3_ENTVE|nr:unnamed protein product [Enterobius vermicularis]
MMSGAEWCYMVEEDLWHWKLQMIPARVGPVAEL